VRQPLPRAIALMTAGEQLRDEVVREIAEELNVKRFEVVASLEGLLSYRVVPNFRTLGPRLGKSVPRVKELLEHVDGSGVRRAFAETGSYTLDVDGTPVSLAPEDVEIRAEQHEDLTLAQDGPHAVALDLTLDDDLRAEGLARELIRALNELRKTNGFALADRVTVKLRTPARIAAAANTHRAWIMAEVLATDFGTDEGEVPAGTANAVVDGEAIHAEIQRA
jgi:isoleucyl-tRNA synthetase